MRQLQVSRLIAGLALLLFLLMTGCSRPAPEVSTPEPSPGPTPGPTPTPSYHVSDKELISQQEAKAQPPPDRWPVLVELTETASIQVLRYPEGAIIQGDEVGLLIKRVQSGSYVLRGEAPKKGPDMKIYFQRSDATFIAAATVYADSHILKSPEGFYLQVDPEVVAILERALLQQSPPSP